MKGAVFVNQEKIGRFIAECRKANGLTQMQLAEKMGVSDRAVSKWENGKCMPDSSIMLDLCKELKISVYDLLNGECVSVDNYNDNSERLLLEMVKQKEEADKRLLSLEIVIGIISVFSGLAFIFVVSFLQMADWIRIVLIAIGVIIVFIGCGYCLKIEQVAGYYKCRKCGHKYVPEFKNVLFAPHINRTRYMKCPECHRKSWSKKVISKN